MGCCESTCMLNGKEFVHCPDIKPLVFRHSEEPIKFTTATTTSSPSTVTNTISGGAAINGPGCTAQQPRPAPGPEVPRTGTVRTWTSTVLQPVSPEVVQFRRLQYRELTPEDYELLCLLDENIPKKDTSPANVVTNLPRIPARDCNAEQCHVCLTRIEPYIRVVSLPCGHAFHPECVSRWLTQCKGTCPLCNCPVNKAVNVDQPASQVSIADVDTGVAKKAARTGVGRCGLACRGGFSQPGVGDDGPAE